MQKTPPTTLEPLSQPAQISGGPASQRHPKGRTLRDILAITAKDHPTHGVICVAADGTECFTSYAELEANALTILGGLQAAGIETGSQVIMQVDRQHDFIPVLWACFLGGIVAVPLTVSPTFRQDHNALRKLRDVWQLLDGPPVICGDHLASLAQTFAEIEGLTGLRTISVEALRQHPSSPKLAPLDAECPAVMLSTSGSTGKPKLVVLSHRNILSMSAGTIEMNGFTSNDATLNWMPLEHVGAVVFLGVVPVDFGGNQAHVPTSHILQNPLRWLDLVEKHHASISWAPNFAFSLIIDRATEIAGKPRNLSSLRFLVNAGEPIVASTARKFLDILNQHGLPKDALRPAFGMSETCSGITWSRGFDPSAHLDESFPELGPPIPGASIRIVDDEGNLVGMNVPGRMQLQGPSVTSGYYRNPEANEAAFTADGWFDSGDLGMIRDGCLVITGRKKEDIIINGINFNSHEIETLIEEIDGIETSFTAACGVRSPGASTDQLAVFFVAITGHPEPISTLASRIRGRVVQKIGVGVDFIIPLERQEIPKTEIGKIQRKKLRDLFQEGVFAAKVIKPASGSSAPPKSNVAQPTPARVQTNPAATQAAAQKIGAIWQEILNLEAVGLDDNFFELGGHSLLLVQAQQRLQETFQMEIPIVDLFQYPTVNLLSKRIAENDDSTARTGQTSMPRKRIGETGDRDIAVIGIGCRFPGASDWRSFWKNLAGGVESISFFSIEEVLESGVAEDLARNPKYVRASPTLSGIENFDAGFFGYSAAEAELLDPQHRLFLECAWECMEDAGYNLQKDPARVGLFAGAAMNTYLMNNVLGARETLDPKDDLRVATLDSMGGFLLMVANDKDYLPTRTSYKLNLRGPSLNVQTACSTTLVVIHNAVQSLLSGECDMAMAGGVSVQVPQKIGHLFQEGMIVSSDGHCRTYDKRADGTIFGSGAGVVLLKPLDRALADGDHIYAVVKGSAVNNDGGQKMGYMAPSIDGQADVVSQALEAAGIPSSSVGFVEAHGTGTIMGDPIEITALSRAYGRHTAQKQFCAVGSVKTNVGHLQISSGIAGFIKAVLSVYHGKVPPTLHFEETNPAIDFPRTPFFVNNRLIDWPLKDAPRRAGVHSLGIGGTNAHVLLEQAPAVKLNEPAQDRPLHILTLSGRSENARRDQAGRFHDWLLAPQHASLEDICFTANTGRVPFSHKLAVVAATKEELVEQLNHVIGGDAPSGVFLGATDKPSSIAFLFPGQGGEFPPMDRKLYDSEPHFREVMDRCDAILEQQGLRRASELLFGATGEIQQARKAVVVQPAIFCLEYALASLLRHWGIQPAAMIGHSLGEYVAACLAGVFSLEDALKLVATRASLMDELPETGVMAAIFAEESKVAEALRPWSEQASIAAVNGTAITVVSGAENAIRDLLAQLSALGIRYRMLKVSHAFHSPLLRPMIERFARIAGEVTFHQPLVPIISNLSGKPAGNEVATADYWCRHTLSTVRFADGLQTLAQSKRGIFVEIGPKPALQTMLTSSLPVNHGIKLFSASGEGGWGSLLSVLAELYVNGADVDWNAVSGNGRHQRVPLPTYPFQRQRYWIEARTSQPQPARSASAERHPFLERKFQTPLQPGIFFEASFSSNWPSFVCDHQIYGHEVISGACYVSMALAAARQNENPSPVVSGVSFVKPLVIDRQTPTVVQLGLFAEHDKSSFKVISFPEKSPGDWQIHAIGAISGNNGLKPLAAVHDPAKTVWSRCKRVMAAEEFYALQSQRHIALGPSYQWIRKIGLGGHEAICDIAQPHNLKSQNGWVHPGLLDACFGLLAATADLSIDETFVPIGMTELRLVRPAVGQKFHAHARLHHENSVNQETRTADIELFDETGQLVISCVGLTGKLATKGGLSLSPPAASELPLYEVAWVPKPLGGKNGKPRNWLLIADSPHADELAGRLAKSGDQCRVAAQNQLDIAALRRSLANDGYHPDAILFTSGLGGEGNFDQILDYPNLRQLVALTKSLSLEPIPSLRELWLISAETDHFPVSPINAPLWGYLRSVALELPHLTCTAVGLQGAASGEHFEALMKEFHGGDRGQQVVLGKDGRRVARLQRIKPIGQKDSRLIKADRTYLLSGGTGALGLITAEWLADKGAKHLVLISRREPSSAAKAKIDLLQKRGVEIKHVAVDAADLAAMREQLSPGLKEMPPLAGVIHAAGTLHDALLADQDWTQVEAVLRPKIAGAWNLHELTSGLPLDFFALYSSAAGVLGNTAQASYSAANAFLDALAHYRRGLGLPATSINWGPWEASGMATSSGVIKQALNDQGFAFVNTTEGLAALEKILLADSIQAAAFTCDWSRYLSRHPQLRAGGFFDQLVSRPAKAETTPPAKSDFVNLRPTDRTRRITELVRETVASLIGVKQPEELSLDEPLVNLGVDSLMAVRLRNTLSEAVDEALPAGLSFNYPTIRAIAGHLDERLAARSAPPKPVPTVTPAGEPDIDLDNLSTEELEALVAKELEELEEK